MFSAGSFSQLPFDAFPAFYSASVVETGSAADSPNRTRSTAASVTEAVTTLDAVNRALSAATVVTEVSSANATHDRSMVAVVSIFEVSFALDIIASSALLAVTETTTGTDSATPAFSAPVNAVESATASAASSLAATLAASVYEAATGDSVSTTIIGTGITEPSSATDSVRSMVAVFVVEVASATTTQERSMGASPHTLETVVLVETQDRVMGSSVLTLERLSGASSENSSYVANAAISEQLVAIANSGQTSTITPAITETSSAAEQTSTLIEHIGQALEISNAQETSRLPVFFFDSRYIAYAQFKTYNAQLNARNYTGKL
jgi:hypothetical protein